MNKKMLTSTLSAMVLSGLITGTALAAQNPFSDVPEDSWAYDAVSQLAADGIIDGYPDGTYKGQNTMTRYEMAQITARAMVKTDLDKAWPDSFHTLHHDLLRCDRYLRNAGVPPF